MGQQAFFEPGEKDGVEFEALGAVQRHQRDGDRLVVFVRVADERGVVEQSSSVWPCSVASAMALESSRRFSAREVCSRLSCCSTQSR